jgi:hypothetical protein
MQEIPQLGKKLLASQEEPCLMELVSLISNLRQLMEYSGHCLF